MLLIIEFGKFRGKMCRKKHTFFRNFPAGTFSGHFREFRGISGEFFCFPAGNPCEFSGIFPENVRKSNKIVKNRKKTQLFLLFPRCRTLRNKLHSVKTFTFFYFFAINFFFEKNTVLRTGKRSANFRKKSYRATDYPYSPLVAQGGVSFPYVFLDSKPAQNKL